ncbi:hypothetical protein BC826DRAFT_728453 [Russula brevipes]|nr:hypothetical protein BC826DRAFT_728453 [Russula brevipes]
MLAEPVFLPNVERLLRETPTEWRARIYAWQRCVVGEAGRAAVVHRAIEIEGRGSGTMSLLDNELEAQPIMGCTSTSSPTMGLWASIQSPYPRQRPVHNLGYYVSSFEDGPKDQFMYDIPFSDTLVSPWKHLYGYTMRYNIGMILWEKEMDRNDRA